MTSHHHLLQTIGVQSQLQVNDGKYGRLSSHASEVSSGIDINSLLFACVGIAYPALKCSRPLDFDWLDRLCMLCPTSSLHLSLQSECYGRAAKVRSFRYSFFSFSDQVQTYYAYDN